jgi:hypothetical protein
VPAAGVVKVHVVAAAADEETARGDALTLPMRKTPLLVRMTPTAQRHMPGITQARPCSCEEPQERRTGAALDNIA